MNTNRLCLTALGAALLASMHGNAHAVRINYVLDAGLEHDDNVRVVANDPVSQNIYRAGLGFTAREETSRLQYVVNGRMDYRNFSDNVYSDTVEGTLSGRMNWTLVPERLSFFVEDNLELQAIDRFAPDSPDNRQQVNVFSAGPNLFLRLGSTMRGQVELRYMNTDAEVTEDFNSDRLGLAVRAIKDLGPESNVSANVQYRDIDFDNDLLSRDHDRVDLYLRHERVLNHFSLGLDLGYTDIDFADGDASSGLLFRGELAWRPTERSSFAFNAVRQFSDTAEYALTGIGDAGSVPENVLIDSATVTSSVYKEKRVGMTYAYAGARTTFAVEPFVQRVNYLDSDVFDERGHGAFVNLSYRLRPTLTLSGFVYAEKRDYVNTAGSYDTRRYTLTLEKQWSSHWSSALSATRYERNGDALAFGDVSQNVIYLRVAYRNR